MESSDKQDMGVPWARNIFRPLFVGREHWLFVVDEATAPLVGKIVEVYYRSAPADDHTALPAIVNDYHFWIYALRKKRMLGHQLNSLLREATGIQTTDREITAHDVYVVCDAQQVSAGASLAAALFDDAGDFPTLDDRMRLIEWRP
jgi:hypothetical protein